MNLFFGKYGTGPYNSELQASEFFGCMKSCSCGCQSVTFLGVGTRSIFISTLKCCDNRDNCNSGTDANLYTNSCSNSKTLVCKATQLFIPNKFGLTLIAIVAIFLI
jgi:hypothetical protein